MPKVTTVAPRCLEEATHVVHLKAELFAAKLTGSPKLSRGSFLRSLARALAVAASQKMGVAVKSSVLVSQL